MILCPYPDPASLLFYLFLSGLVFIGLPIFVIYLMVKVLVRKSGPPYNLP